MGQLPPPTGDQNSSPVWKIISMIDLLSCQQGGRGTRVLEPGGGGYGRVTVEIYGDKQNEDSHFK